MNMKYALRSEDTEQITVFSWSRYQLNVHPELRLLHHCPNEGKRTYSTGVKQKQMGMLAGVPDFHLPVPKGIYSGLYIEMKYGDGRIQPSQREFLKLAAEYGNFCVACYTAEEAIQIIREYVELKTIDTGAGENRMKVQNTSILKEGKVKAL